MVMDICYLSHSSSSNAGGIYEIEKALASRIAVHSDARLRVGAFYDDGYCDGWLPECHLEVFGKDSGIVKSALDMRKFVRSRHFDILHLHNLWTYPSLLTLEKSLRNEAAVIITINGMLDPWALGNSRYKKKIAAFLFEKLNLNRAKLVHVNSEREAEDCRRFGIKAPVAIIPNGVEPSLNANLSSNHRIDKFRSNHKKRLLFLGRIHEKKGLIPLVEAWSQLPPNFREEWVLDIVGWDDRGFEAQLRNLTLQRGLEDSVVFHGPLYGDDKIQAYEDADAFILPSFSEGLPMAVLEAWSAALPTIISPQCNLSIGYARHASLPTAPETSSIVFALKRLMEMSPAARQILGENASQLVREKFSWDSVANNLMDCYRWCLGEIERPHVVEM